MNRLLVLFTVLVALSVACWAQDPNAQVVQGSATGTALPVTGSVTATVSGSVTATVSGTVNSNVSGTVTADQGAAGVAPWLVDVMNWPSTFAVTQSTSPWVVSQSGTWNVGLLTGSNTIGKVNQGAAGATAWLVDGSAVTQPVSGTFWQAVQPVSGTVTANAGSGTFTVGGTVTANAGTGTFTVDGSGHTQPVSGTVAVSNFPATQPVSGTVTANQGTSPWVVDGSGVTQPVSGTFWQATQPVSAASLPLPTGAATETTLATLPLAQASTTSGQSGVLSQGAVTTAAPTYTTAKTSPLSLTTAGALRVDGSAVTQPVSGTVTANAGSGTFTVGGTVTANAGTGTFTVDGSGHTQPVSGTVIANAGSGTFTVDGSGHTQPISAASLPLPSGASTSAKQPALGTAGTASADVITVQGIASMTALKVDGSGVTQPVSGTVTANAGTGTFGTNVAQVNGTTTDTNSGSKSNGTLRVVLATDQPALTNALKVDGSGVTQPVSGTVTANAGTGTFNVDGSGHTQPVSGTVTANQGTSPWVVSGTVTANVTFPAATAATVLASAARTATTDSSAITGGSYRRLSLFVSVTAGSSINLTPRLQLQDPISGDWFTVWAGPGINAIKDFVFYFADGAAGGAWTGTSPFGVPGATFRFEMLHNNANSVTYSVSDNLMP